MKNYQILLLNILGFRWSSIIFFIILFWLSFDIENILEILQQLTRRHV